MPNFIKWDNKFNTGNFVIDHQHRRLVQIINDLEEAISQPEHQANLIKVILEEASNYTQYHFQTEEELMESFNYTRLVEHRLSHQAFIQKIGLFKIHEAKGEAKIDVHLCEFLRDWFITHVADEDQHIVVELNSKTDHL